MRGQDHDAATDRGGGRPAIDDLVPIDAGASRPTPRRAVASYSSYAEAERAVDSSRTRGSPCPLRPGLRRRRGPDRRASPARPNRRTARLRSVGRIQADRYDVMADEEVADEAARLLSRLSG